MHDSTKDWTNDSRTIFEHSNQYANGLLIYIYIYIYIYKINLNRESEIFYQSFTLSDY